MSEPKILIEAKEIYKIYTGRPVLRNVSLSLKEGECVTVSGTCGSGKSTLLRLLAGLVRPTSGTLKVVKDLRIQYVPDSIEGNSNMTAGEFMISMAQIDGYTFKEAKALCQKLFERYRLLGQENKAIRRLSAAAKQKLLVCQALLKPCDLLIMDEPVLHMDEASQKQLYQDMAQLSEEHTAIVYAGADHSGSALLPFSFGKKWYLDHGVLREEADESIDPI